MPWDIDNLPPSVRKYAKEHNWSKKTLHTFVKAANDAIKEYKGKKGEGKAIATGIEAARETSKKNEDAPVIKATERKPEPGKDEKDAMPQSKPTEDKAEKAKVGNHVEELKDGKFRLLSHEGKNLGTFDSREAAEKHERQVEYFKHNSKRLMNAKTLPLTFYCRHMQPGLAGGYAKAGGGTETLLIEKEAIDKMMPTFINCPVYVEHQDIPTEHVEEYADGYITDSFFNPLDGWYWCRMLIVTDNGMKACQDGYSVSNSYVVGNEGPSGEKNGCSYDAEVLDGRFEHMALVPNPRYEDAKIFTPDEYEAYCKERLEASTAKAN